MSNHWSDDLRKRMENHQEPSPNGLWEDIEQIMEKESFIKTPSSKQNKIMLWSKRIASVAAILLAGLFIGKYLLKNNINQTQVYVLEKANEMKFPNILSVQPDSKNTFIAKNSSNKIDYSTHKTNSQVVITEETIGPSEENNMATKSEDKNNENNVPEKKHTENPSNSKKLTGSKNMINPDTDISGINHKHKSANWATNIYASNISSTSSQKHQGYDSFANEGILMEEPETEPIPEEYTHQDILIQNKYREVYTDIKHKQPIVFGASVNYNLDDKWGLSSGLIYTILSSNLRSGSDNYYYKSEQTLHNIGISLGVNYNAWKTNNISIYLSAGGLVEKNVYGKLATEYISDNRVKSNQEEKISVDELQWSLNSSVGIQYNFSSKIGIYAEPGVSYYFNNGSEVETIYKDKPLNLNLKVGLRFSLNQ